MFKKIKTIEDVYRCFLSQERLIISKQKEGVDIYNFSTLNLEKKINSDRCFEDLFFYENNIFLQDTSSNLYHFNDNISLYKNGIRRSSKRDNLNIVIDKIIIYEGFLFDKKYGVYSLEKEKILWWSNKKIRLYDDFVFCIDNNELLGLDVNTGEILWRNNLVSSFNLKEQGVQVEMLGVFNNCLVAGIKKNEIVFVIDCITGEIKWHINTFVDGFYINQETGILHQIMGNYCAFDIITGKLIDNYVNDDYLKEVGIESFRDNYVMINKHIITSDWRKGVLGAFNTITHKFDWIYEEKGVSFPATYPIKYFEPYLFVMDSKETLHIFKNEDKNLTNV